MKVVQIHRAGDLDSLEDGGVLLIGGYGVGNTGDEAILAGMLRQYDLWDATVVSLNPDETRRLHGVNAVHPLSASFPGALLRCRRVVIGGGGIFSGYMGHLARWVPAVALGARSLGKRVEFRAFGAYRGTPRLTGRMLARAVQRADVVSVRDESSRAYLQSVGVARPIPIVPDPALALDPAPRDRARQVLAEGAPGLRKPFVAFGVRRVKDPVENWRLEAAVAGLGSALLHAGLEPLFVPFSRHPRDPTEDDERFARNLRDAIGGGQILEGVHHPRDVLGVLREAQCVVAVRFHALVFGLRAGRPVVGLPYDAKCRDLMARNGIVGLEPSQVTARALTSRVFRVLDQRRSPAGLPPAIESAAYPGRLADAVPADARDDFPTEAPAKLPSLLAREVDP